MNLDTRENARAERLAQRAADRLPQRQSRRDVPRATARLQLNRDFRFEHAAGLVGYYNTLGVSHVYASPILVARPGSTHGYDVVDPGRVNPELGGEKGLRILCRQLQEHGMGLIVDIVPNHMAVGKHNPWWQDVLRWGRRSRYADWFDIDWESPDPALAGKLLLPFLGRHYADALEAGELALRFDEQHGQLHIVHHDQDFPLSPYDYATVLAGAGSAHLQDAITLFSALDAGGPAAGQQAAAGWALLRALAQDADGMAGIHAALAAFSAERPQGREALHRLLERQHYRLAFWRNAADEINWRRFFEVSELAGMRVETEEVFEAMHAEIFRLYAEGLIDGVRLDHIDGLADPGGYCRLLRRRLRALRAGHEPWIIAEKILARDERLPPEWELDGTTGYEFMDQCAAVLHDPEGEPVLDDIWRDIVGELGGAPMEPAPVPGRADQQERSDAPAAQATPAPLIRQRCELADFDAIVREARRGFLVRNFAAEFNALTLCLHRLARSAVQTRDISLMAIRRSVAELLVHFPVYRTYATAAGMPAAERETLACAAIAAGATLHAADHAALHVVEGWLGGDLLHDVADEHRHALQLRAIARFQQLTPPLTAKSVEDTAFYRYGRLLSRNEVGSDPSQLTLPVRDFHRLATLRAAHAPYSLLATATHDHKRGEDARMRLAALSEIPEEWHTVLRHWRSMNAPIVQATAGAQGAIDAADECMLYQTLIGAWPDGMRAVDDDLRPLEQLAQRVVEWQRKALREGKRRSDWLAPQLDYEAACERFVRALLCDPGLDPRHHPFLVELEEFVRRLAPLGTVNSLSQTMLKLCAPGIPDFYQGTELWDLSLVDPDNRSAVDFPQRIRRLADAVSRPVSLREWHNGGAKLQLIRAVLQYRRSHAELFGNGGYIPLSTHGKLARHVIAFARILPPGGDEEGAPHAALVVCTRLAGRLLNFEGPRDDALPLVSAGVWGDTRIAIPAVLSHGDGKSVRRWRSALTSGHGALEECAMPDGEQGGQIAVAEILGSLPVELLELHG
ncbi:malto-oligosyltrehalose synthase [Herbaspirillum sp. WKF16]|uniref:malto-oligosyltrehalose synthase n=1 Tax=Herbaspirillum sp. WKF16 TaxID=3028312 RepID=UPI0023A9C64A|nr:malto-oligosyltrehalose synthase [Herbaspirillum sp. WKF16]WDZ94242.1 malto-oligosyltrehalose synthase [Herbaspirillum sp. WKF16]